ncbi:MAG: hypothetical protein ACOX3V_04655 [Bacillota bacterium]
MTESADPIAWGYRPILAIYEAKGWTMRRVQVKLATGSGEPCSGLR